MLSQNLAQRFVSIGECMVEMSGGDGGQYRMGFAGDTLNTAWYARAALDSTWQVDYVTALGDDLYSHLIRAFLDANRIGTGHIQTIKNRRPGLYLIHQAEGDRHFTYWRENSAARLLADDEDLLHNSLVSADLIYFSGISMAILTPDARKRLIGAISNARQNGAQVAYDPNIRPALWADQKAIAAGIELAASVADIALPTFDDDAAIFGDVDAEAMADRYLSYGVSEVVVKNGPKRALVASPQGHASVSANTVQNVVDATGAGDSFAGAYIAARLQGCEPENAARKAHATAAIVIGHAGALVPHAQLDAAL